MTQHMTDIAGPKPILTSQKHPPQAAPRADIHAQISAVANQAAETHKQSGNLCKPTKAAARQRNGTLKPQSW